MINEMEEQKNNRREEPESDTALDAFCSQIDFMLAQLSADKCGTGVSDEHDGQSGHRNDFGKNNENLLNKNDLLKSNYDFLKKILDK